MSNSCLINIFDDTFDTVIDSTESPEHIIANYKNTAVLDIVTLQSRTFGIDKISVSKYSLPNSLVKRLMNTFLNVHLTTDMPNLTGNKLSLVGRNDCKSLDWRSVINTALIVLIVRDVSTCLGFIVRGMVGIQVTLLCKAGDPAFCDVYFGEEARTICKQFKHINKNDGRSHYGEVYTDY